MSKGKLIKKAVRWAHKQGFMSVKANHSDFEEPTKFSNPVFEEPIIPDVTGTRAGGKFYVEVATKSESIRRKVSKWQLLSKLAQMKGGKLLLLTPHGHKSFAKRIVEKYNINAKVINWKIQVS